MNLISLLIALALEIYYKPVHAWRRFDWFHNYTDAIHARLAEQSWRDGPLGVLLVVGSVLFGIALLDSMLGGVAGIFSSVFGIVVLVLTLGPNDLVQDVQNTVEAMQQNDPAALRRAAAPLLAETGGEVAEQDLPAAIQAAILLQANRRVFGVLLWFMLLGPVGALMFRLSSELTLQHRGEDGFSRACRDLYRILIWLPSRLVVLGFALAGSFVHTLGHLDIMTDFWKLDSETLLVECGRGAVAHEVTAGEDADAETLAQTLALAKRTLMVWLAVLALLTLTGWVI